MVAERISPLAQFIYKYPLCHHTKSLEDAMALNKIQISGLVQLDVGGVCFHTTAAAGVLFKESMVVTTMPKMMIVTKTITNGWKWRQFKRQKKMTLTHTSINIWWVVMSKCIALIKGLPTSSSSSPLLIYHQRQQLSFHGQEGNTCCSYFHILKHFCSYFSGNSLLGQRKAFK